MIAFRCFPPAFGLTFSIKASHPQIKFADEVAAARPFPLRRWPSPYYPAATRYTLAQIRDGAITVETTPVTFTRVRPGESLLREAAE